MAKTLTKCKDIDNDKVQVQRQRPYNKAFYMQTPTPVQSQTPGLEGRQRPVFTLGARNSPIQVFEFIIVL